MTREVLVTIEGLLLGEEEDMVITSASGIYHYRNGKHYIQYDEASNENGILKNSIKISSNQIVMIKKGAQSTQMIFDLNESTQTHYHTPYGSLSFYTNTTDIKIKEEEEEIRIYLLYSLSSEDNLISNNQITIKIAPNQVQE